MSNEDKGPDIRTSQMPRAESARPKQDTHQARTQSITFNLHFPKLPTRNTLLKLLVWVLILTLSVVWWKWPAKNTIPPGIRSQLSFKTVFPTKNYDPVSFRVIPANHALQFTGTESGIRVVVTEQSLPANSGPTPDKEPAVLLNHLGVRYFNQTPTKLGILTVAKFWTNNYVPYGQTGILGKNGTLVLARPDKDLSDNQWIDFFNNFIP